MSSWTRGYAMLCNAVQQAGQQHPADALGTRLQQSLTHIQQFVQRAFEAQPQRIGQARFVRRFYHQPVNQHMQQNMSRHLVANTLRGAAPQAAVQSLDHFQFAKRGLDFPTPMIKPRVEHAAGVIDRGQPHPFFARNGLRIEHVGYDRAGPKTLDLVTDYPQRHRCRQAQLFPFPFGRLITYQAIVSAENFQGSQGYARLQTGREKGPLVLDLPEQAKTPKAAIDQDQVVGLQAGQQAFGDAQFRFLHRRHLETPGDPRQGELQQNQPSLGFGNTVFLAFGRAKKSRQSWPARQVEARPVQSQQTKLFPMDGRGVRLSKVLGQQRDQSSPECPGQFAACLNKPFFAEGRGILAARMVLGLAPLVLSLPSGKSCRTIAHQFEDQTQDIGEVFAGMQGAAQAQPNQGEKAQSAPSQSNTDLGGSLCNELLTQNRGKCLQIALTQFVPYRNLACVRAHCAVLLTKLVPKHNLSQRGLFLSKAT